MISNYRCQIHELLDLIPSPCVVFDLAPFLARRRGIFVVGDTPTSPGKPDGRPCNPFLAPDQTSSPVVDALWCDITPLRSRHT